MRNHSTLFVLYLDIFKCCLYIYNNLILFTICSPKNYHIILLILIFIFLILSTIEATITYKYLFIYICLIALLYMREHNIQPRSV